MFDSYRDLFLSPLSLPGYSLIQTGTLLIKCAKKNRNSKIFWPKRQTLKLLAKCFIQAILLSLASYISDVTSVLWHTHVPYNCRINRCIGETPTKWKIEIHTEGTNFGKNHHFILIRDTIEIDNVAVKITLADTNFIEMLSSCTEARLFASDQNSQYVWRNCWEH